MHSGASRVNSNGMSLALIQILNWTCLQESRASKSYTSMFSKRIVWQLLFACTWNSEWQGWICVQVCLHALGSFTSKFEWNVLCTHVDLELKVPFGQESIFMFRIIRVTVRTFDAGCWLPNRQVLPKRQLQFKICISAKDIPFEFAREAPECMQTGLHTNPPLSFRIPCACKQ